MSFLKEISNMTAQHSINRIVEIVETYIQNFAKDDDMKKAFFDTLLPYMTAKAAPKQPEQPQQPQEAQTIEIANE